MPVSVATYGQLVLEDPEGRWEYWCGRPRRKPEMTQAHEHLGRWLAMLLIREIDINPFGAAPRKIIALDAPVVLYGPEIREAGLPEPAIRPYPSQLEGDGSFEAGTTVTIRPEG